MPDIPSKAELRSRIRALRRVVCDPERLSGQIAARLMRLTDWEQARSVLFYVSVRDEVSTRTLIADALKNSRRVVVPYCVGELLELVEILAEGELEPGAYGILEPVAEVRQAAARRMPPVEIDLVLVPGVVFDRRGGRLGYGRGFYDRLLSQLRPRCLRVGLAFACQVVETVPVQAHDEPVDVVITEQEVIYCRRRPVD